MYSISVGREGFNWTGMNHQPRASLARLASTAGDAATGSTEKMTGGTRNPLGGVMALYLGTTLYRIHGTNDVKSIGQAQSSGCFRMMNASVVHLAGVAGVGTMVTVVASLPKVLRSAKSRSSTRLDPLRASQAARLPPRRPMM